MLYDPNETPEKERGQLQIGARLVRNRKPGELKGNLIALAVGIVIGAAVVIVLSLT